MMKADVDAEELVELVLAEQAATEPSDPPAGVEDGTLVIGQIERIEDGAAWVRYAGVNESCAANSIVSLGAAHVGRSVALAFPVGSDRPMVMGVVRGVSAAVDAQVDGDRVTLEAEREVVLRCGKASITLTRAGKIILEGEYVLNRSNGINRIQGAAVEIN